MKYVLGVGTNLGSKRENIERCINSINLTPYTDVLMRSGIYETEPVGYARQDNFYNCVLLVESELEPNEMLGLCLGIESGFGRKRGIINGPRILDIDLLLAENVKLETRNLSVPHPRIRERRFVLQPMLDLFPSGTAFDYEFASYIDKIDGQFVNQIEPLENYYIED
ncbi:MAG: 2-amino-4-hydroxy-6-hydroxymethyldihydropteridine diphosphokinase [Eubacterium sp.]|nr:2-amino-4-hydroxy-6-hydroxymethyldihydropteridine diphosphokinase [Eubacterium sp.]